LHETSGTTRARPSLVETRWCLIGNVVLCASSAGWMVVHASGAWAPPLLALVPVPLSMAVTAAAAFVAARSTGAPPAAAQFWRQLSVAIVLIGIGSTLTTVSVLEGTTGRVLKPPAPAVPMLVAGVVIAMWALLRLPMGTRTRRDWIRMTLDGLTVTGAAALALWHLALRPQLHGGGDVRTLLGLLLLSVIALLSLVAVMKLVLTGSGPVHGPSLRLIALTALFGGLTAATSPLFGSPSWLGIHPLIVVIQATLACGAAHLQSHAAAIRRARQPRRRSRPYSVLPYFGVAATDFLLIVVVIRHDEGLLVVVAGSVAVTAVVVVRQILSFHDNAQLLSSVREQERQLRYQASHDALTELSNRRQFAESLAAVLADKRAGHRADGSDDGIAVMLIDLDDFKTINDTLGHPVGDGVITAVAHRLNGAVGEGEIVARLGGDEFGILLRDRPGSTAVDSANRLLSLFASPIATSGHQLLVLASAGIAVATPTDDLDTLLRNAEIAMYAAKEAGTSGLVRFSPDLAARVRAHAELAAQLGDAIGTEQFYLLYQPIVRLWDRAIVGTEALIRWNHPVRGPVLPTEFIPTAEHTGLIVPLGRWVLQEACRQAAAWRERYGDSAPYSMNVNVAGWQLRDPNFLSDVVASLAAVGLPARHLVIEVTETAVLDDAQITAALHALRELGIRLALDDFGTAASSLGLLLTCPVTTLKLDRSFVERITTVARQKAVATAVIHIADALNLHAVAEGIEDEEQASALVELGYVEAQGYLFARPLTAAQIEDLLVREPVVPVGSGPERSGR
jgi:diguanylate cyclase (GGDEF)-like protein